MCQTWIISESNRELGRFDPQLVCNEQCTGVHMNKQSSEWIFTSRKQKVWIECLQFFNFFIPYDFHISKMCIIAISVVHTKMNNWHLSYVSEHRQWRGIISIFFNSEFSISNPSILKNLIIVVYFSYYFNSVGESVNELLYTILICLWASSAEFFHKCSAYPENRVFWIRPPLLLSVRSN